MSQLVTDPPATLVQNPNVPSVEVVDDLLVACVGQMAVTAGSDLLWKPLNHEVITIFLTFTTVYYLLFIYFLFWDHIGKFPGINSVSC